MADYFGAIPLNADKELFAEDFIYWFLKSRWHFCSHIFSRADVRNSENDKYREFIYNALNENIKMAIYFIDNFLNTSILEDFISMEAEDRVNDESFIVYANNYAERYFPEGFEPSAFLIYCTRLANLAGYFYVNGKKGIFHVAVDLIVKALPEGDLFSGTWDTLNQAAQMFVKLEEDRAEVLTPSDSNTETSDTSSEPSDTSSEPSETSSEPSDTSSEPSDTSSEPSDTSSEPSDTSSESGETS